MRRVVLGVIVCAVVAGAAPTALAHATPAGGCNSAFDGHGPGGPTVTNPATGGEYWLTPSFVSISGGTGYVTGDGESMSLTTSNADGTAQSKMSPGGVCISVAGQTQKIGDP